MNCDYATKTVTIKLQDNNEYFKRPKSSRSHLIIVVVSMEKRLFPEDHTRQHAA